MTPPPLSLPARVVLVDDHPLILEGIKSFLAGFADEVTVVGCADNSQRALALVKSTAPDLVVMDFFLDAESNGLETMKAMIALRPGLRVLVFSLSREEVLARDIFKAGGFGFLMKTEGTQRLMVALRQLSQGRRFGAWWEVKVSESGGAAADTVAAVLSDRELQVFHLLSFGHPPREIAAELNISVKTVAAHQENMKNKLNCQSADELEARAREWRQRRSQLAS